MTRSCCKQRKGGTEGLSHPADRKKSHPQRRSDGELGLETTSWDALVYHSYFSVQVFSTDSSAPGQNTVKEGKMHWLPKPAALQRGGHRVQHRQQLGSQQLVSASVFSKQFFSEMLTITEICKRYIMKEMYQSPSSGGGVLPLPPHTGQNQSLPGGRGDGRQREGISCCSSHACSIRLPASLISH